MLWLEWCVKCHRYKIANVDYFLFVDRRHYKDNNDRTKKVYHKAVTASDEAFIWQILTCYADNWAGNGNDGDDSLQNSTNSKRGPNQGFVNTAGKTLETYAKYCTLVGDSRKAPNMKLWSERLMMIAKHTSNVLKREEEKQKLLSPPVATIAMEDHLMMYTSLNLCAMGPGDFAEDPPADTTTTDGAVEEV